MSELNAQMVQSLVWTDVVLKLLSVLIVLGVSREAIMLVVILRRHMWGVEGNPTDLVTIQVLDSRTAKLLNTMNLWKVERDKSINDLNETWIGGTRQLSQDISEGFKDMQTAVDKVVSKLEIIHDDVSNLNISIHDIGGTGKA